MASQISEKAVVSPKAKIGENCHIYPFVYIEDDVEIGDNCILYPFVSVLNGTRMGNNNKVFQGAVLGAEPQDTDFKGDRTQVLIGRDNTIRENVIINRATFPEGQTIVGNGNVLMEGAHISHDTHVGHNNILGYGVKIAGNCEIGNGVILASSVVASANTRVGDGAMVEAGTSFFQDVPPYIVAGGKPVNYGGPNVIMMNAYGVPEKIQKHIANAYRLVFHGKVSVFDAVLQIKDQVPDSSEIQNIIKFINSSKAGIIGKD